MVNKILFVILTLLMLPTVHAALQVTAFSCTPEALLIGDKITCQATISNSGSSTETITSVSLILDGNWAGASTTYYGVSFSPSAQVQASASAVVFFQEIKPIVTGSHGFSSISGSPALSLAENVDPTTTKINAVAPIQVMTAIAPSEATKDSEFTVSATLTASGNLEKVYVALDRTSGDCSLMTDATKYVSELKDGVSQSLSWRLTQGSGGCGFQIWIVNATAGKGSIFGIGGTVTGSVSAPGGGSTSGAVGGGGGGGASALVEGFQDLTSAIFSSVIQELNLAYKQYYAVASNSLASILAITGDYTGEYAAPNDASTRDALAKPVKPLEGDVYELAAKAVRKKWQASTPTVVVARGDLEVDSLSAVAYARAKGYPILLTKPNELPSITLSTLKSLGATKIMIAGGNMAVSQGVEAEFQKFANTERIFGKNRAETAVELAKSLEKTGEIKTIVVTDGLKANTDAALLAANYRAPVLYTSGATLPQATKDFLVSHSTTSEGKKMKIVFVGVDGEARKAIEAATK